MANGYHRVQAPGGKVYLSAIIDCYDGYVVGHAVGVNPTAELANSSLREALKQLDGFQEPPIIHSDRGGTTFGQITRITKENGLLRSMSRKACTADNAACEGFFWSFENGVFLRKKLHRC